MSLIEVTWLGVMQKFGCGEVGSFKNSGQMAPAFFCWGRQDYLLDGNEINRESVSRVIKVWNDGVEQSSIKEL